MSPECVSLKSVHGEGVPPASAALKRPSKSESPEERGSRTSTASDASGSSGAAASSGTEKAVDRAEKSVPDDPDVVF